MRMRLISAQATSAQTIPYMQLTTIPRTSVRESLQLYTSEIDAFVVIFSQMFIGYIGVGKTKFMKTWGGGH